MPAAAGAESAAASSEKKAPHPVNPDRVGEELADDANIWHVYDRIAKEDDERRTKAWDNGLNNLALFAGLFSAVTTAFIIEAQQDMKPDYAQLTFLALNASASGEKFVQPAFVVPGSARTTNCLWVTSLVLSLCAALIAIMGKDWIGMYSSRPVCNLRQWAEMRTYRLLCVERWYMSGLIAAAPVLLHVSLLLFGTGLVLFISSDPLTHHLTLGLCLTAGALYLVTTLSAVVFSGSPFKSPATQMLRAAVAAFHSYAGGIIYRPKRNLVHTVLGDINRLIFGSSGYSSFLPGFPPADEPTIARRSLVVMLAVVGRATIAYVRSIPPSLHAARGHLQWPSIQSRLRSISSAIGRLRVPDWFLSSRWTDLPVARRPELLAAALSWLNSASPAPDVFRALLFALGDLEIGGQVAPLVSSELNARMRDEIRRTHQEADYLTLSRYILAERNLQPEPTWDSWDLGRFEPALEMDLSLRCEDGLAAAIKIDPFDHSVFTILRHCPAHVAQPRMMEFLLPSIAHTRYEPAQVLIVLANCCMTGMWHELERHVINSLDGETRKSYASKVTVWRDPLDDTTAYRM
ncbi:hypothetical protein AURDEDRAFT_181817 [Auricularia subglabra TFB-10046 SS5]|nr:hypothetical protein AURDEDRAFT_181817 [Auricularia subglabra TFB-10046 SS5]